MSLRDALEKVVGAMEAHQVPTVTTKTLRDLLTAHHVDVTDEMMEAAAEEMWPNGGTLDQHRQMRNALKAALPYLQAPTGPEFIQGLYDDTRRLVIQPSINGEVVIYLGGEAAFFAFADEFERHATEAVRGSRAGL